MDMWNGSSRAPGGTSPSSGCVPPAWRSRLPSDRPTLPFQLFPQVFDRLADLATAAPEPLLNLTARLVGYAFVVQPLVVGDVADTLLDAPLDPVHFPVQLVFVHGFAPSTGALQDPRRRAPLSWTSVCGGLQGSPCTSAHEKARAGIHSPPGPE